jgi:transcriptional regulator of heat shock response
MSLNLNDRFQSFKEEREALDKIKLAEENFKKHPANSDEFLQARIALLQAVKDFKVLFDTTQAKREQSGQNRVLPWLGPKSALEIINGTNPRTEEPTLAEPGPAVDEEQAVIDETNVAKKRKLEDISAKFAHARFTWGRLLKKTSKDKEELQKWLSDIEREANITQNLEHARDQSMNIVGSRSRGEQVCVLCGKTSSMTFTSAMVTARGHIGPVHHSCGNVALGVRRAVMLFNELTAEKRHLDDAFLKAQFKNMKRNLQVKA